MTEGVPSVIHGFKCLVLLDEEGQPKKTYSIAAGLDYPGIGPEHSHLKVIGRAEYVTVTNEEVLEAFQELSRTEGIIPALESAHAVAHAKKLALTMGKDQILIVNLSGRGDKDVEQVFQMLKK
ncbi:Tryptophan synthase beta chain [compost metagenome]